MRSYLLSVIVVAAAIAVWGITKDQSLQEMIERANAAAVKEQPALYINIAERQLKTADDLYNQGKAEAARAAIADVVTYTEKAHDAAVATGKRLKPTEMASRKMSHRLRDLHRTLDFEDQPPVKAAADRLEYLAQDLLTHMFGKTK
jgi:hypothetical protein